MNLDEATRAYIAARKLRVLYDAYIATSQANLLVLNRLADGLSRRRARTQTDRERIERTLLTRAALSRETAWVFSRRAQQITDRIRELRGYAPHDGI